MTRRGRWDLRRVLFALLLGVAVLVVVTSLLVVAVVVPPRLINTEGLDAEARLRAENDLRSTLATLLGGIAILFGAIVAALNFLTTNASLRETQRQNERIREQTQQQLELQRRGQVSDRFSKAIDQLSQGAADKLDLRLGAIYALEQIAQDSRELHAPILEILTAFVRQHASYSPPVAEPAMTEESVVQDLRSQLAIGLAPSADVQTVLTVLGRRNRSHDSEGTYLDLRSADLRRASLEGAHLEGARLEGAHLEGARLDGAHLQGARLDGAHLQGARLDGAHLAGASLDSSNLKGADLLNTDLEGAWLPRVNLEEAWLTSVNLSGANLSDAHLDRVVLHGARLERADLSRAQLREANLTDASLERASLVDAHLEAAHLPGTNLRQADLSSAYLTGVDLTNAHLQEARLQGAHLEGANLEGARLEGAWLTGGIDLSAVQNLTQEQFDSVHTGEGIPPSVLAAERPGDSTLGAGHDAHDLC